VAIEEGRVAYGSMLLPTCAAPPLAPRVQVWPPLNHTGPCGFAGPTVCHVVSLPFPCSGCAIRDSGYETFSSEPSSDSSISSMFIFPMCFRMSLLMRSIDSVVPVSCVKNSATASTMLCFTHNMNPSWITM
jgi:hypothetical protein